MNVNTIFNYFFFLMLLFNTHESFSQENLYSIPDINKEELINIQKKILNGDVRAYDKYKTYCIYKLNKSIDLLPYALIQADKYSYAIACYDVASILLQWYSINKIKMDSSMHDMMFSYLRKGCDLKDRQCCHLLSEIYFIGDIYTPIDTFLAKDYAIKSCFNKKDSLSAWKTLLAFKRRAQELGFPMNHSQDYTIKKEE